MRPTFALLSLILPLAGCIVPVVVPIPLPPTTVVVGERWPEAAPLTPAPASWSCPRPARANAAEAAVLAQVNALRKERGLTRLQPSSRLRKAAQGHACDNAARQSISHTGSDGADLRTRLTRSQFQMRTATENTARGFDEADRLVAFWMASPAHRTNLLNPQLTQAALGLGDNQRPHWVFVAAAPR